MSVNPVRWGILGTSPISHTMAKAILESSVSQLVAIGSRAESRAQAFAAEFSVPKTYTDYDVLLADPEIDVVYLGLPNHLHKDWIIRCAQAGKHILCEKPLVVDLAEAKEIFAVLQESNVFCMEALMYRCHPFTIKLQELIQNKVIGDLRFFNACYMANIAAVANPTRGGAILNLGCYPISLVRLLASCEPVEMFALGEIDRKRNNDCRASVVLKFSNTMSANVYTADDMGMFAQFDIYGTEGFIKVKTNPWMPRENNQILIYRHDSADPQEIIVTANQSTYTYQIDHVSHSIRNKAVSADLPGISWQDSLGNVAVLEAWQRQVFASENSFEYHVH